MKKIRRTSLLFIALIGSCLFSSCFDLVVQIDMNHDGSGQIKATLNLSKSKTKVASLLKLRSVNGIKIPSEATIRQEMEKTVRTLKATSGISNVQYSLDLTNYIAVLSCNFKNVQALNNFSRTMSQQLKTQISSYNSYSFDPTTQTFSRTYKYSPEWAKEFSKIPSNDQKLFGDAYYTNIIRFQKNIKSQTNKQAKVSSNARGVMLKVKATDLINGNTSLANTVTLTK